MGDEVLKYPRGRVSKGAGDLIQVTDVTVRLSKGKKLQGTLRDPEAGVTRGESANEMTFKAVIDANGFERDWKEEYDKDKVSQYRLKLPGLVVAITGEIDDLEYTTNMSGAIEFSAKIIGKNK